VFEFVCRATPRLTLLVQYSLIQEASTVRYTELLAQGCWQNAGRCPRRGRLDGNMKQGREELSLAGAE
jgi:hypothetical protein